MIRPLYSLYFYRSTTAIYSSILECHYENIEEDRVLWNTILCVFVSQHKKEIYVYIKSR